MMRRHLTTAAAGLAVLLAAGCASAPGGGAGGSGAAQSSPVLPSEPASSSGTAPTSASAPPAAMPAPVVIDPQPGAPIRVRLHTTVTVRGDVVLACPPRTSSMEAPVPERCTGGTPLDGVDPDRLTEPTKRAGTLTGYASLTADYDGHRLTVISQRAYDRSAAADPTSAALDAPIPCLPPGGGWPQGEMNHEQSNDVQGWIESHPEEYGALSIAYPVELPKDQQQSGSMDPHFVVLVVGTTGDIATADSELSEIYSGNLCVVPSTHSHRETYDAWEKLRALDVLGPDSGVSSTGIAHITAGDPVLTMTVDRWTPRLDDIWHRIGTPDLILNAWMHPAD